MLPTPKVGEHTINKVDEDTDQNEDQGTTGIINILLFRRARFPSMVNDVVDNIVHENYLSTRERITRGTVAMNARQKTG